MAEQTRHRDTGNFAQVYYAEMLVVCPKCGASAIIRNGRLVCDACGLMRQKTPEYAGMRSHSGTFWATVPAKDWYSAVQAYATHRGEPIPSRCNKCGGAIPLPSDTLDFARQTLPTEVKQTCTGCNTDTIIPVSWRPQLPPGTPRDPLYGCELLLAKAMRDGTLFAYNARHARDYLAFIQADHRERAPEAFGNTSWFTNLPAWIKSAKNRDKVARALRDFVETAETSA